MATAAATKLALKGILSLGKKIRKQALDAPLTKDYQYRRGPQRLGKQITGRKLGKYKSAVGEKTYNKYLKDFSKLYKTLDRENFQKFRKQMQGISPDFWLRSQINALNKGFINSADTKKVAMRAGSDLSTKVPSPKAQKQIDLKRDRRDAISKVYKQIADEAPTNKAGLPILAKNAFGTKALFPRLKQQFPELFKGLDDTKEGRKALRRIVDKSPGKTELAPFPTKLKKPDFVSLSDTVNPTEVYFKKQLRRYTGEGVDKQGDQYFVDQWRSRGPEFRTGNDALDVKKFLEFERSMGTLDPGNPYYYKNNPEFKVYSSMRKIQEPGMELAHDRPTLNPLALKSGKNIPTETVPGSGSDVGFTHFLERDVNRRWQPFYENKYYNAMLNNRYDKLPGIESEMIKRNIRTRIIDPNTGEERIIGGWKEFGFSKGGKMPSYAAGGIGRLGAKLLQKLIGKLSDKELQMILDTSFKGTKPLMSPAKIKQDKLLRKLGPDRYRWRNVKSEIPGPKTSLQRQQERDFFEHTEFWPDMPKESKVVKFPSAGAVEDIYRSGRLADRKWEQEMLKKLKLAENTELKYPFLNPENNAFIVTGPRTSLGRYRMSGIMDTEAASPVGKYAVYDWWDDVLKQMRKKPKFKYVKDDKGNVIMKKIK